MQQEKKICIVTTSLGRGGAERSTALLSVMLDNLGYNVHLVSVLNELDYEYSGTLLNLGIFKEKEDTILGRFKRFVLFKKYIEEQQFDIIIDNRTRLNILKEYLIKRFLYRNQKVVYVTRSSNFKMYLTNNVYWANKTFSNVFAHVGVSHEITNTIKTKFNFNNVLTINNPIDFKNNDLLAQEPLEINEDFILFYGRLEDKVKNVSMLIDAYKISKLPQENVKLVVLGDGEDLAFLMDKANSKSIVFKPFTNNPFPYVKNAKFCCLTSRFEGFPRVLIESLSLDTPVVTVDCSGVKDIVKNEFNGLIVRNNNPEEFAEAMNRFIFDTELYKTCKLNAKESIAHLSLNNIAIQWHNLLKSSND